MSRRKEVSSRSRNYPNLFIVGAPKCGTTALAQYLNDHGGVAVSDPKEPGFWGSAQAIDANGKKYRSIGSYLKLFSHMQNMPWRCDASTNILASASAIDDIEKATLGEARYIVMLRNPADLVFSLYREERYAMNEDETNIRIAWELQEARRRGDRIPARCSDPSKLQYREIACLGSQLERLLGRVERSRVHIVVLDDMRVDSRRVYVGVLKFLNLADDGRKNFEPVNTAKMHRYPKLAALVWRPPLYLRPLISCARSIARVIGLRGIRAALIFKLTEHDKKPASMDASFYRYLQREFAEEVSLLEKNLGRTFSSWRVKSCA